MRTLWNIMYNYNTLEGGHAIRELDGTITRHGGPFKGEWFYELKDGDIVKFIRE